MTTLFRFFNKLFIVFLILGSSSVYADCLIGDNNSNVATTLTVEQFNTLKTKIQSDPTLDITTCDVSGITDMSGLFQGLGTFNQDISQWNVSNVTDMGAMFEGATAFNKGKEAVIKFTPK